MTPAINPYGITIRQERHLFLYGPREFTKSTLISRIIGHFDYVYRTYRPENHPRFFMNHFNGHKFILFENFKFCRPIIFISSAADNRPGYMERLQKSQKRGSDDQQMFRDSFFSGCVIEHARTLPLVQCLFWRKHKKDMQVYCCYTVYSVREILNEIGIV